MKRQQITVSADIGAPIEKVWEYYNNPEHVVKWNNASSDWHTPRAENDLKKGGRFIYRMEARDGSAGFDFTGTYDEVEENKLVAYTMDDGRKARVNFEDEGEATHVDVTFDAEEENSLEMQREGWQAILDNFKQYVEAE